MVKHSKIFQILQSAIWGKPLKDSLESNETEGLLHEAQRHAVAGLVIDALVRSNQKMDRMVLFEALALREQIAQLNKSVNRELRAFVDRCVEHKTDYIIIKGQTIGSLYDNPELGQPGDIDFLIKEDYQKIKEVMSEILNTALPDELIEKELAVNVNGVLFELHGKLFEIGNKRIRRYWERRDGFLFHKEKGLKILYS